MTDGTDETEANLVRDDGEVNARSNYCQYRTDDRLDRDDGAEMRGDVILRRTVVLTDSTPRIDSNGTTPTAPPELVHR